MSAVIDTHGHGDHHDDAHGHPHGLKRWIKATNHKDIGTLYLWFSFTMLLIGGINALLLRSELFKPGLQIMEPEFFNQLTTMHGLIMVFGAIMPAFVGFANWMIPMQIGAADMAFARMQEQGLLLEFGVHKGGTINYVAERNPNREVHGFDSFTGLPGDWIGSTLPKGAFDLKGRMPSVRPNVRLHKGLFSDTLPAWMAEHNTPIAFVHVDCDLYGSTRDVFDNIGSRLGKPLCDAKSDALAAAGDDCRTASQTDVHESVLRLVCASRCDGSFCRTTR